MHQQPCLDASLPPLYSFSCTGTGCTFRQSCALLTHSLWIGAKLAAACSWWPFAGRSSRQLSFSQSSSDRIDGELRGRLRQVRQCIHSVRIKGDAKKQHHQLQAIAREQQLLGSEQRRHAWGGGGGQSAGTSHGLAQVLQHGRPPRGDQELRLQRLPRRGRLRVRVQGVDRRGHPGPGQARRRQRQDGRHQEAQEGELPGPQGVAHGGDLPRGAPPRQPRQARGLLLRLRQQQAAGVRVHAPRQPREPPLPPGQRQPAAAALGHARRRRRRRGPRPRLPPLPRHHLPGPQVLQRPPGPRPPRQALRLRARQGRAHRRQDPRLHPRRGHARVRRARVRRHGPPVGQERRLRLRGGAAGAHDGEEGAGRGARAGGGAAGGLGEADAHGGQEEGHPGHGHQARRAVQQEAGAGGGRARAPLPQQRPQEPPHHGR